jgi:hypothetical protein
MIALVTTDPGAWIIFGTLVGTGVGFFGCGIFASRRIQEVEHVSWQKGYEACNREHARNREI